MNAAKVIALCKERGLKVYLGDDGQPRLSGPTQERTPTLLAVLKKLRNEIITHLGGQVPIAAPPAESPVRQLPAREVERIERVLCGEEVVYELRDPTTDQMQSLIEDCICQGMPIRKLNWVYRIGDEPWQAYESDVWYPFLGLRGDD